MADLMTDDLLTPSSLAANAIRFCKSADKRNAISGYLDAGVLVLVIAFFFLCWLVLHLHYTCLSNHLQPARESCAPWLSDGYI